MCPCVLGVHPCLSGGWAPEPLVPAQVLTVTTVTSPAVTLVTPTLVEEALPGVCSPASPGRGRVMGGCFPSFGSCNSCAALKGGRC